MRIVVLLVVPVIVLGCTLMSGIDSWLSPGNLWKPLATLQVEADRAAEIQKRLETYQARRQIEWNLAKSLVADDISLADAIQQLSSLRTQAELARLSESLRHFGGDSNLERFCRCVLADAETVLDRSGCSENEKRLVMARLDKAMRALLKAGSAKKDG